MNLEDLKKKYKNAHKYFEKYRYSNTTNNIEEFYKDNAKKVLEKIFPNSIVCPNNDNFHNYLGDDFFVYYKDKIFTVDLKICNNCFGDEVMIDAYKKDENRKMIAASNFKINDLFLFKNSDKWILVRQKDINIPPKKECFFLSRDLYHTTMKAIINTKNLKRVISAFLEK